MKQEYFEILVWILFVVYPLAVRLIRKVRGESPSRQPSEATPPQRSAPVPSDAATRPPPPPATPPSAPAAPSAKGARHRVPAERRRIPLPAPRTVATRATPAAAAAASPIPSRRSPAALAPPPDPRVALEREIEVARAAVAACSRLPAPLPEVARHWFAPPLAQQAALVALAARSRSAAQWHDAAADLRAQRLHLEGLRRHLPATTDSWTWAAHVVLSSPWRELARFLEHRDVERVPGRLVPIVSALSPELAERLRRADALAYRAPDVAPGDVGALGALGWRAAVMVLSAASDARTALVELAGRQLASARGSIAESLVALWLPSLAEHGLAALLMGPAYLEALRLSSAAQPTAAQAEALRVRLPESNERPIPPAFAWGLAAAAALRRNGLGAEAERSLQLWRRDLRSHGIDDELFAVGNGPPSLENGNAMPVRDVEAAILRDIVDFLTLPLAGLAHLTFADVPDLAYTPTDNARARSAAAALRSGRMPTERDPRVAIGAALLALAEAPGRHAAVVQWLMGVLQVHEGAPLLADADDTLATHPHVHMASLRAAVVARHVFERPAALRHVRGPSPRSL